MMHGQQNLKKKTLLNINIFPCSTHLSHLTNAFLLNGIYQLYATN